MYKYAAACTIFDGISNICLVSIVTVFLAGILALYISNFLKDENESQAKKFINNEGEENHLDTSTEMENRYRTKKLPNSSYLENKTGSENNVKDTKSCSKLTFSANECYESYCDSDSDDMHVDGLVGKLKSNRVKELEAKLTRIQLEEEKRIEREQLAAIFELLKKQETELNMKEIDETELNAQLALYR